MSRICARCGQKVYAAEERLGLNQSWHVRCFTCATCNRTLDSFTLAENRGLNQIYCKVCYRKKFATKGYGYGPNEPTLLAMPSSTSLLVSRNEQDAREEHADSKPSIPPGRERSKNVSESIRGINQASITANAIEPKWESSLKQPSSNINSAKMTPGAMASASSHSYARNLGSSTTRPNTPQKSYMLNAGESQENDPNCSYNIPNAKAPELPCPGCIEEGGQKRLVLPRYPAKPSESKRKPLSQMPTAQNSRSRSKGNQQSQNSEGQVAQTKGNGRADFTAAASNFGSGEPCKRCKRPVYWAEMKLCQYGAYHQECFTCCCCGKPLESTTVNENQGEIFCKGCYRRYFGTHGIGYGLGAGALQTP